MYQIFVADVRLGFHSYFSYRIVALPCFIGVLLLYVAWVSQLC
jgi:hypothetical protein